MKNRYSLIKKKWSRIKVLGIFTQNAPSFMFEKPLKCSLDWDFLIKWCYLPDRSIRFLMVETLTKFISFDWEILEFIAEEILNGRPRNLLIVKYPVNFYVPVIRISTKWNKANIYLTSYPGITFSPPLKWVCIK